MRCAHPPPPPLFFSSCCVICLISQIAGLFSLAGTCRLWFWLLQASEPPVQLPHCLIVFAIDPTCATQHTSSFHVSSCGFWEPLCLHDTSEAFPARPPFPICVGLSVSLIPPRTSSSVSVSAVALDGLLCCFGLGMFDRTGSCPGGGGQAAFVAGGAAALAASLGAAGNHSCHERHTC